MGRWVLTKLQGNLLQVTLSRSLKDGTANKGGAGESDLVNVHVAGDGGTSDTTETRDDVNNTRGETSLNNQLGGVKTRQRSLLGGLQNDGVAGGNGRTDLPSPHEDREVPGNNLATDTNGLVAGVGESLGVGVNGLAVDLVGPATVVTKTSGGVGDINLGHGDGLAVVQSLNGGQDLDITLEEVGQLGEEAATLGGGHLSPDTLEALAGSLDGNVDILLGGLVHRDNGLLVGGVDGLEGLAVDALDEFVVDEPVEC